MLLTIIIANIIVLARYQTPFFFAHVNPFDSGNKQIELMITRRGRLVPISSQSLVYDHSLQSGII